jgi:hypothetical protein
MKYVLIVLVALLVVSSGCNKNKTFIKDLENFVSDVECNYKYYSAEDWFKKDKEFTKLSESRFQKIRGKLTQDEITEANELVGKYRALKIKKRFEDFKTGIKDLYKEGKEVVKKIIPDSEEVRDAVDRGRGLAKELLSDSIGNSRIK